jgi:predicted outer membrane protein
MVDDHGKANDQLKSLARTKNITLPSDLSPKDKALHDRLSKLSGAAFDRAYMRAMVTDHTKDVNEFRTQSKSGVDPDIKSWASSTLPTLESHLKMAQDANRAVGTSGTLPTDLNSKDKALLDRLSKLSGPAFDRAYMQAMVTDHTKDVNEFKAESKSGADADVKSWAANTLPTLETHLKMAQDANRAVGTSGVKK